MLQRLKRRTLYSFTGFIPAHAVVLSTVIAAMTRSRHGQGSNHIWELKCETTGWRGHVMCLTYRNEHCHEHARIRNDRDAKCSSLKINGRKRDSNQQIDFKPHISRFLHFPRIRQCSMYLEMLELCDCGPTLPSPDWGDAGYRNVWVGVTAEDQEYLDQRWHRRCVDCKQPGVHTPATRKRLFGI
jgi:hypothetical protein